jgi:hypothetical protein
MSYQSEDFIARAEECARLARLTRDEMIQTEILQLRQFYLHAARRLEERKTACKLLSPCASALR